MVFKKSKLSLLILSLSLALTSAFAQDEANSAKQVVEKFQTELISVMKEGKKLGYAGRYAKLQDPVINSHDLPKIARVILGKDREALTPDQQKTLEDVIIRLSIASYAHNFKEFSGEEFAFDSEEETSNDVWKKIDCNCY